jgi:hypothetical protein
LPASLSKAIPSYAQFREQNLKGTDKQIMTQDIMTPDLTYLKLSVESNFQEFFKGYIRLLEKKFEQVEVHGDNYSYSYWTCGLIHHPQNPDWKPFKHLWNYCERTGYDFFEVRDLIEERIGHKMTCECQLVDGGKARRRLELERTFGVDFGEPGKRGVDVV